MPASAFAGSKRSSTRRRARFSAAARAQLPVAQRAVEAPRVAPAARAVHLHPQQVRAPVSARICVSPAAPSMPPGARASGRPRSPGTRAPPAGPGPRPPAGRALHQRAVARDPPRGDRHPARRARVEQVARAGRQPGGRSRRSAPASRPAGPPRPCRVPRPAASGRPGRSPARPGARSAIPTPRRARSTTTATSAMRAAEHR